MNNRPLDSEHPSKPPVGFTEPLENRLPTQMPLSSSESVKPASPATSAAHLKPSSASNAGSPLNAGATAASTATPSLLEQTLQSRLAILATLFCVTGALGLPLLWVSPAFSRFNKVLWSVIVIAYTSALIGGTWAIIVWAYRQFR